MSPTSQTPSEKFPWAGSLQWDRPGSETLSLETFPARGKDLRCPCKHLHRASSRHTRDYLHPIHPLAHCTFNSPSPRAPWGRRRPSEVWWLNGMPELLWPQTGGNKSWTIQTRRGGEICHCGACAGARPTAHTWGDVPHSPELWPHHPRAQKPPRRWGDLEKLHLTCTLVWWIFSLHQNYR